MVTADTTAIVVGGLLVVTHTGTVTAGLFHGDTVVRTGTGPVTNILLSLVGRPWLAHSSGGCGWM